ncbi:hypothetical protein ABTE36_22920, partial [Acinetobacter baumannii]
MLREHARPRNRTTVTTSCRPARGQSKGLVYLNGQGASIDRALPTHLRGLQTALARLMRTDWQKRPAGKIMSQDGTVR